MAKWQKQIDIVYILGKGSNWQNNEIRYSLRSLEKHVTDVRNVFIVGEKPSFLNEKIIHIPFNDIYSNKARNIMAKVHRVSGDQRLTVDFMLWNDDYFALQPFSAINYPYYYKCGLDYSVMINKGEYKLHCEYTLNVLRAKNLNYRNFDCHFPIIYNKIKMRKMIDHYNWDVKYGYVLRSMYCNHFSIPGEIEKDCKTNHPMPKAHIEKQHEGKHFFSIGEGALNFAMKSYIMGLYPNKSKYEY